MNQLPYHHGKPHPHGARQCTRQPLPALARPAYHEAVRADSPTSGTPHHEVDHHPTWHTKEGNQL